MARRKYKIGDKIGSWEILGFHEEKNAYSYIVKCKCGEKSLKTAGRINKTNKCIKCHERTVKEYRPGEKINNWEIIVYNKECDFYICRCKCGKEKKYKCSYFRRNKKRMCTHCASQKTGIIKAQSNIGKIINDWKILEVVFDENILKYYICEHRCGEIKKHSTKSSLRRFSYCNKCVKRKGAPLDKMSKFHKNQAKEKIGKTIGNFKVIGISNVEKGKYIYMICKCLSCKKECKIPNGSIPYRQSCGCIREKNRPRGEENYLTKLTDIDVISMRELFDSGLYKRKEIAEIFGLRYETACNIISKSTWKHI